jgi:hypothetical protein
VFLVRWLVEVTSLGKSDKESLSVEADSWQKALQAARAQRGEAASMNGFSIELLDDGCRAIDPATRLRYDVRKAPEESAVARSIPPRPASVPAAASSKSQPPWLRATTLGSGPAAVEAMAAPSPEAHRGSFPPTPPMGSTPAPFSQILSRREQDATETLPLTYREYAFLVAPGTAESAAESFLLAQIEMVRASLERVAPGKLVNLAVFDVSFKGKPPEPPLATLAWKDWRGAPVLTFPRRPKLVSASPPPSMPGPAPAAVADPVVASAAPVVDPPPPDPFGPRIAPTPIINLGPTEPPPPEPETLYVPPPPADLTPSLRPAVASAPAPAAAPPPAPSAPPPAALSSPPVASAPPPAFYPPPVSSPPAAAALAPPPAARFRVRGEDLIADLFEAMHDLHFVRDALEGGEFCLALAMEKLPSEAGLVHLYDIDRREFLVTSTRGTGASKLLLQRYPENDGMLRAAMRKGRALVVVDATGGGPATLLPRYGALGGARSLLVAPVIHHGRFLGAIELLNPLDGQPFNESEGNALTYIAEQFAEFISSHGIVTDPERIHQRHLPGA